MYKIEGKYCTATVLAKSLDSGATGLVKAFCDSKVSENSKLVLMPDAHTAKGCCVGTVLESDKIFPGLIGGDIGCGILVLSIETRRKIELEQLDKLIHEKIPSGMKIHDTVKPHHASMFDYGIKYLNSININFDANKVIRSIGTLGGGNHFIEVGVSENYPEKNNYFVTIHTGSRSLGQAVCKHFQDKAHKLHPEVPYEFAYFDANDEEEIVQFQIATDRVYEYAMLNRTVIGSIILDSLKVTHQCMYNIPHNFCTIINTENELYTRTFKGAIVANELSPIFIPINMKDGILKCVGLDNKDWLGAAPHGAGRLMSRTEALQSFTVNAFKKRMNGVYSSTISKETLDECPMAYKPMDEIIELIKDSVIVEDRIIPIYNFKAGREA